MLSKQLYRIYCAVYSGGRGGGGVRDLVFNGYTQLRDTRTAALSQAL